MRIRHIVASLAFLTCCTPYSFAQEELLESGNLENELGLEDEFANPFDLLGDDDDPEPIAEINDSPSLIPAQAAPTPPLAQNTAPPNLSTKPTQQPPSALQRRPQPVATRPHLNIEDTIVNHATTRAMQGPIAWSPVETPNPIADILLRQQCVDGLWSGYQAQRAQECIKMMAHLHGCHCQACGSCAPTAAAPCGPCNQPINRYTQHHHTVPVANPGCTDCASNRTPPLGAAQLGAAQRLARLPAMKPQAVKLQPPPRTR